MRNLIALTALLCTIVFHTFAQQDTTTFTGKSNYIFQHVNKNDISTGLLAEYGIEFLPFENYDGVLLADSNYGCILIDIPAQQIAPTQLPLADHQKKLYTSNESSFPDKALL